MGTLSPILSGLVKNGKFNPDDREAFKKAFYIHEGRRVSVTVKREQKRRTNPQNAYYWGVVVPLIGTQIGESDAESVHDLLKNEHNYEIKVVGNSEIRVPHSTATLDTIQFSEYVEKVRRWAAEFLHLYIPDPNEAE